MYVDILYDVQWLIISNTFVLNSLHWVCAGCNKSAAESTKRKFILRCSIPNFEWWKQNHFLDKMAAEQPIKLSNMPVSTTGTVFLNKGTIIQDVPCHSVPFQYRQLKTTEITNITDLQNHSSGTFTVSGLIQWSGPPHKPTEESTKLVRDGTITDSSGSIKLVFGKSI